MSLTLGEKLRQAREERGFSLSEVSEQTRISSLYLESIENDDYGILPGGIFNKGFVKSYAKFVGLNEQEALLEYSRQLAASDGGQEELKRYKPEVLTDDNSSRSMIPTVVGAFIILAVMTGAILFGISYLRQRAETTEVKQETPANSNSSIAANNDNGEVPVSDVPDMATLKVEFKATTEPVSLTAVYDGKTSSNVVTPGSMTMFEPKESLKLSYSKSLANVVELAINGKPITLPSEPLVPRRNVIEFEINKDNLAAIWTNGAIRVETPDQNDGSDANTTSEIPAAPTQTRSTPATKPSPSETAATTDTPAVKASPSAKPSPKPPVKTPTPKPPTMTKLPANAPQ